MSDLLTKLASIHERRSEISKRLADPDIIADQKRFVEMNREYRDLGPIDEAFERFRRLHEELSGTEQMIRAEKDPDMLEMVRAEQADLKARLEAHGGGGAHAPRSQGPQ